MSKGQRKYDGEQKVAIIERKHKEHLGIMETAELYGVYHNTSGSVTRSEST